MTNEWTDRLAGARMQVDQRFQETLDASSFTNQEWGLVMTAIDWDIENPEQPDAATLVADTSKLSDIIPELENIQQEMGGAQRPVEKGPDTSGIFGRLKRYIHDLQSNSSGESSRKRFEDAKELVDGYTVELQSYLEERGQWEDICQAAAAEQNHSSAER
ncbi:DUF5799 family protein [Salinibaculum rarum]|uniref:DUF5799 family protein n=1 Tax=Salinibaculum rarum TaxID=3058903 RepID=UPI00265E723A|nr:DUF5799 family protein [Salinibaculum sp. KK48]